MISLSRPTLAKRTISTSNLKGEATEFQTNLFQLDPNKILPPSQVAVK